MSSNYVQILFRFSILDRKQYCAGKPCVSFISIFIKYFLEVTGHYIEETPFVIFNILSMILTDQYSFESCDIFIKIDIIFANFSDIEKKEASKFQKFNDEKCQVFFHQFHCDVIILRCYRRIQIVTSKLQALFLSFKFYFVT